MNDTTTQEQLPPCPFKHTVTQGSRAIDYAPYATDEFHDDGKWNVICPVCSAGSGFYDTAQEAEEAWSRRADPPDTLAPLPHKPHCRIYEAAPGLRNGIPCTCADAVWGEAIRIAKEAQIRFGLGSASGAVMQQVIVKSLEAARDAKGENS